MLYSKPLVCTEEDLLPRTEFPDTLLVEKFGIQGTICAENWDDRAATVACRQLGYTGGVSFGPRYYSSRTPIWLSSVNCTGKERNINDCSKAVAPVSQTCLSSRLAARVFCYNGNGRRRFIIAHNSLQNITSEIQVIDDSIFIDKTIGLNVRSISDIIVVGCFALPLFYRK